MKVIRKQLAKNTLFLSVALLAGGCGFYGTLLGYPSAPKASQFEYYDPNFQANNTQKIVAINLQLTGFYMHHDTASFLYNTYEKNGVVRNRATSYNYLKFLDDGRVVNMPTINPPDSSIHNSLKSAPWFSTGRYKIDGDTVRIEMKNELKGNKSYFFKALTYENGIRVLSKSSENLTIITDYQYLPE